MLATCTRGVGATSTPADSLPARTAAPCPGVIAAARFMAGARRSCRRGHHQRRRGTMLA